MQESREAFAAFQFTKSALTYWIESAKHAFEFRHCRSSHKS